MGMRLPSEVVLNWQDACRQVLYGSTYHNVVESVGQDPVAVREMVNVV